jgi:hypothetical protein
MSFILQTLVLKISQDELVRHTSGYLFIAPELYINNYMLS